MFNFKIQHGLYVNVIPAPSPGNVPILYRHSVHGLCTRLHILPGIFVPLAWKCKLGQLWTSIFFVKTMNTARFKEWLNICLDLNPCLFNRTDFISAPPSQHQQCIFGCLTFYIHPWPVLSICLSVCLNLMSTCLHLLPCLLCISVLFSFCIFPCSVFNRGVEKILTDALDSLWLTKIQFLTLSLPALF